MKKKLKKIVLATLAFVVALSQTVSANEIETSVDSGGGYLLVGFLAILKWGGILGTVASFVGICIVQDSDALKKLKITLIITILCMVIGFAAKAIVGGVVTPTKT